MTAPATCPGWAPSHAPLPGCGKPAGTPWTPVWCDTCDEARRAHISASLHEMLDDLTSTEANPDA